MLGETILVIDSDSETAQSISSALEAEDYLVFTAPTGEIGITMAKKVRPSLIFLNPTMQGSSGLELCKTIHSTEQLKNVPIVALSSFEGAANPRFASDYGIIDSLKKPFTTPELVSKTKTVLSKPTASMVGEFEGNSFPEEEVIRQEEDIHEPELASSEAEDFSGGTMVNTQNMDDFDDKTVVKSPEMPETSDETLIKQAEIPDENFKMSDEDSEKSVLSDADRTYVLKKSRRRRGMRSGILMPIIVVLIVAILGASGFLLYQKGLIPWFKSKAAVVAKPAQLPQPITKELPQAEPIPQPPTPKTETKPEAKTAAPAPVKAEQNPVPKAEVKVASKPVPAPAPKAEMKLSGKVVYSVQIGAFKSQANADTLAKQLKAKGYDAFVQKGIKGQEAIFRVLIGKHESMKEASKIAKDISVKENTKAVVFKE